MALVYLNSLSLIITGFLGQCFRELYNDNKANMSTVTHIIKKQSNKKYIIIALSVLIAFFFIVCIFGLVLYRSLSSAGLPTSTPISVIHPILSPVDELLQKMKIGSIAFNTPKEMQINQIQGVQLIIGPSSPAEELEKLIQESGVIQSAQIRISDRMHADLAGDGGFEITPVTPEEQFVSSTDNTEWRWTIKAIQPKTHNLYLTINAILNVNGKDTPRSLRVFKETIEVRINPQLKDLETETREHALHLP